MRSHPRAFLRASSRPSRITGRDATNRAATVLTIATMVVTAACTSAPDHPSADVTGTHQGSSAGASSTTTNGPNSANPDATGPDTASAPGTSVAPDPVTSPPFALVDPGEPGLVVGHRGNRAGAPEDTLPSEVSAYHVGAQVLEFDLHMTSDNVPVVMHDDTVDRTTDGTGRISSLTLADIQQLDAGTSYSPAFSWVTVPTFEQILAFASFTDAIILPELKEDSWTAEQVDIVADLIRHDGMTDRTMFQSFHPEVLRIADAEAPDIARAGLVTDIPADPVAAIHAYHGQALLPENTGVTDDLVATLHQAGLGIMVWTVDDADEWARLTAAGVDGIMSNNPAKLAGWIAAYRQQH